MKLLIDSSVPDQINLEISSGNFKAEHHFGSFNLSENLLLELKKFLKKQKIQLTDVKQVLVKTDNRFSKTRTVVASANALIYALRLKQKLFKPKYNKAPNITLRKK